MFYQLIKKYQTSSSIILFIITVLLIQYSKPAFLCNLDGSYKTFGLGYRNKTVVPMWFIVILIAILSYTAILHFSNNRISYN